MSVEILEVSDRVSLVEIGVPGPRGPSGPTGTIADLTGVSDLATFTDKFVLIGDGTEFKTRLLVPADVTGLVATLSGISSQIGDIQTDIGVIENNYTGVTASLTDLQSQISSLPTSTHIWGLEYGGNGGDRSSSVGLWWQGADSAFHVGGALTVDLSLSGANKIDWGTGAGSGTVSATSAQIVRTSGGIQLNVPSGTIQFYNNGTFGFGVGSIAITAALPITFNVIAASPNTAAQQIYKESAGVLAYNAAGATSPGSFHSFKTAGTTQQTIGVNGTTFATAAGTVGTTTRGLYTLSTGLALNVETGKTVSTYVNGVLQQTFGTAGITLLPAHIIDWGAGAGTATPSNTSTQIANVPGYGLWYNATTAAGAAHSFRIDGIGVFSLFTGTVAVASGAVLNLGSGSTGTGLNNELYAFSASKVYINGGGAAGSVSILANGVVQQTFSINGQQFNTAGGAVTAATRGLYTVSGGLSYNVETSSAHSFRSNNVKLLDISSGEISTGAVPLTFGATGTPNIAACQIWRSGSFDLAFNTGGGSFLFKLGGFELNRLNSSGLTFGATAATVGTTVRAIHSASSGNGGATTSGFCLNVETGATVSAYVNGVAQQTLGANGIAFPTVGTIVATDYSICRSTTQLSFNVPTSSNYGFAVNNITQVSMGDYGVRFFTPGAGTVLAATRGIYNISSGFTYNVETGGNHIFAVNNTALFTVAAGIVTTAVPIKWSTNVGLTATDFAIGLNSSIRMLVNVPTGGLFSISQNAVIQQTFDLNGIQLNTIAGTVTAGTRGIYTTVNGLEYNVETGVGHIFNVNGITQQTLGTAGLRFLTTGGAVQTSVRGIYTTSIGLAANVETSKYFVVYVNGTAHHFLGATGIIFNTAASRLLDFGTTDGTAAVSASSNQIVSGVLLGQQAGVGINLRAFSNKFVVGTTNLSIYGNILHDYSSTVITANIGDGLSQAQVNIDGTTAKISFSTVSVLRQTFDVSGIKLLVAGQSLYVKQGSNASAGTGTLVAGEATIATTAIATGDLVFIVRTGAGGTVIGDLGEVLASRVNGTSFLVRSVTLGGVGATAALDTSTFAWFIVKAA